MMRIDELQLDVEPIAGALAAWHADVDASSWRSICATAREQHGRLVALWGSERIAPASGDDDIRFVIHAALAIATGLVWITHPASGETYPDIADIFPAAARMQRAVCDLIGIRAVPNRDTRPWLRHGAWPADWYPLRKKADPRGRASRQRSAFDNLPDNYAFVRVEGDGVHEIPVGPVHAGTIEPGHFRFSVLGERVLRLEARLGYTHKGIEKRFEQMTLAEGARLAGRISGDATVGYAWAYAMAVEGATGCEPPPRASWLRALFLERERLANHLGDLGFLGNDAGFAFGLSQFSRLKEDMLRLHGELFGHRYLMDAIVPGGVAHDLIDLSDIGATRIAAQGETLESAIAELRAIYEDHAGLQDRFHTTGIVKPELAQQLGLCGQAGRASGQAFDARIQHPVFPYSRVDARMIVHSRGDVAARVRIRFDEAVESLRLIALILKTIPEGPISVPLPVLDRSAAGVGLVEGWRGPIFIALEAGTGNRIERVHAHDPSWQNWPLLEHAIIGNIVPDFPLINKSFNLSYSGHDL